MKRLDTARPTIGRRQEGVMPLLPRGFVAATILVTIVTGCGATSTPPANGAPSSPNASAATAPSSSPAAAESSSPVRPTGRPPDAPAPRPGQVASAVWSKPRLVAKGDCPDMIATVDSAGRDHIVRACDGDIEYLMSPDGLAWSQTTFKSPAHRLENGVQLAVDGDTVYLAYSRLAQMEGACGDDGLRDLGVYVRSRHLPDGMWSDPSRVGDAGDSLQAFRVQDGVEHLTVSADDGAKVFYESVSGAATTRIRLPGAVSAAVRVGDDGHARVAFSTGRAIRYGRVDGDQISSKSVATSKDSYLYGPSFVLGGGAKPYLMWTQSSDGGGGCASPGPNPTDGTYFSTASGDHWTTKRISRSTSGSAFTVDADTGRIHALVSGVAGLRYFTSATGEDWTSKTLPGTTQLWTAVIRVDPTSGALVVIAGGDKGIYILTQG